MSLSSIKTNRQVCSQCRAVFRAGFARCPIDGTALQQLQGDPLIGETFANRYVIEECVGEGGMGRVYRARHTRVSRRFALKVLFGDLAADSRMRTRFLREGEAASRLSHPNVVSVSDVAETPEGQLYLVMDYVEGPSLQTLIEEQAPFEVNRAANLLRQLASGLGHAHNHGLVHRDFKPDNVIVTRGEDGEMPKILDFGLARIADIGLDESLTTDGQVMGTPAYMSPEHATRRAFDARLDLFSLGVVLYQLLCGKLPFSGSRVEQVHQNIAVPPPAIATRVPGLVVDSRLEAMAMRLMAKNPDDRYPNTRAILAAIAKHPTLQPELRQRARDLSLLVSSDSLLAAKTKQTELGPDLEISSSEHTRLHQTPRREAASEVDRTTEDGPAFDATADDGPAFDATAEDGPVFDPTDKDTLALDPTDKDTPVLDPTTDKVTPEFDPDMAVATNPWPSIAPRVRDRAATSDVPTEMVEPIELKASFGGARWVVIYVAIAAVAAIATVLYLRSKVPPATERTAGVATSDSIDAGATVVATPIDAGVAHVAIGAAPDAAVTAPVPDASVDAGAAVAEVEDKRRKRRTAKRFLRRYRKLAERYNRFEAEYGDTEAGRRAAKLYDEIDLSRSLHDPEYLVIAWDRLKKLSDIISRYPRSKTGRE